MTDLSVINLGNVSKPVTVLIEKISNAIGVAYEPCQIRRVAQAKAEAEKIMALSKIEISDLTRRAMRRCVEEETQKQENIEEIISKATPQIEKNAQPQNIEDDWIVNFFDKSRLISDTEMQQLWSKILAGEANAPGTYSKRTINFLGSLDKNEALLFKKLCGYCWFSGELFPLIYDFEDDIYSKNGIIFSQINHLSDIGLVSIGDNYQLSHLLKNIQFSYYGKPVIIGLKEDRDNVFEIGRVVLSKTGKDLARICGPEQIPGFFDYIIQKWKDKYGLIVSFPE